MRQNSKNNSLLFSAIKQVGFKGLFRYAFYSVAVFFFKFIPLPQLRVYYLRMLGAKIGENVYIGKVEFKNYHKASFPGLTIGDCSYINDDVLLDLYDKLTIGRYVTIGFRTMVFTHLKISHVDHPLKKFFPDNHKPLTIGDYSLISSGCIITPYVNIGRYAVVHSGTVVLKDLPDKAVLAMEKAKILYMVDIEDKG
jgi:acetyltransferase-like isoleucine patch superfamily enzyme